MSRCWPNLVGLAVLTALHGACARAPTWPPAPAALRAGEDSCAECRMIVSDARFAVQRHSPDGELEWFDDLGCLLEKHSPGDSDPAGVFVHDFEGDSWVRGDRGYAVRSDAVVSPMGYGWRAYASPEAAKAAAAGDASADVMAILDLLRDGTAALPPSSHLSDPDIPWSH